MTTILSRNYVSERMKAQKEGVASATSSPLSRSPKHGTVDYAEFKGFKSSLTSKPTRVDPVIWAENVVDLKKVHTLTKHLYLLLEGANEAMLRVCVELLTCRKSRKAVLWHEDWYADEERREWFGTKVKEKLRMVLEALGKRAPEPEEDAPGLAAERRRADDAEAKLAAAEERNQKLLQQLQDDFANAASHTSQARLAELEDAAKKNQGQMRDLQKKLCESEEQVRQLQSQLEAAQTRAASCEASATAANAAAAAAREALAAAQEKAAAAQEELATAKQQATAARAAEMTQAREREKMEKEVAAAKSQAAAMKEHPVAAASAAATSSTAAVLTAENVSGVSKDGDSTLRHQLSEKVLRIQELEAELAHFRAFVRACGLSEAELKALAEGKEVKAPAADAKAKAKADVAAVDHHDGDSSPSLRRRSAKPEGEPTADEQMAKLRAENKRLKVAIEELQLRLKHLMGECRSSGLDEVPVLVDKVGLGGVIKAKTVWDRLYKDALKRVGRVKDREASRAVLEELMPGVSLQQALEESQPLGLQNFGGLHEPSAVHRHSSVPARIQDDHPAMEQQLRSFGSVQQDSLLRHYVQQQFAGGLDQEHMPRQPQTVATFDDRMRWREGSCSEEVDGAVRAVGAAVGGRSVMEPMQRQRHTMVTFDEMAKMRGRSLNEESAARGGAAGSGARRGLFVSGTAEGGTSGYLPAETTVPRAVFAATATGIGIGNDGAAGAVSSGSFLPGSGSFLPGSGASGLDTETHPRRLIGGGGSITSSGSILPAVGVWPEHVPERGGFGSITSSGSVLPGLGGGWPEERREIGGVGSITSSGSVLPSVGVWPGHNREQQPRRSPRRLIVDDDNAIAASSASPNARGPWPDHELEQHPRRPHKSLPSMPTMSQSSMRQRARSREASPREHSSTRTGRPPLTLNASISLPSMPVAGNSHDVLAAATQMMHLVTGQRRRGATRASQPEAPKFWRP